MVSGVKECGACERSPLKLCADCIASTSDAATRHPKWQRVDPGHVIPAGQPYRVENEGDYHGEYPGRAFADVYADLGETMLGLFIDSTWSPPLELPSEPTWGIPIELLPFPGDRRVIVHRQAKWQIDPDDSTRFGQLRVVDILDFIPLTPEQVARIEAAR